MPFYIEYFLSETTAYIVPCNGGPVFDLSSVFPRHMKAGSSEVLAKFSRKMSSLLAHNGFCEQLALLSKV